jgi:hypothetical protein
MRGSSWTDREPPAIILCVGKGKAGPLNSVMRLPYIADEGQTGGNAGTEVALWEDWDSPDSRRRDTSLRRWVS